MERGRREKEAVELLNMLDLTELTAGDAERIDNGYLKEFVLGLFRDGKAPEDVMHQNHTSHSNHSSHTNHHNTAFELKRPEVRERLQRLLDEKVQAEGLDQRED